MTFREQLAALESFSERQLREYLYNVFALGLILSPLTASRDQTVPDILSRVFRSASPPFQERFRTSLAALLDNCSLSQENEAQESLALLLLTIGWTGAGYCRERLLWLANQGILKGRVADREDLHLRVLRILVGCGIGSEGIALCARDLYDPWYAPICYRGLYEADLRNAETYCVPLVQLHCRHPRIFFLDYQLRQMIAKVSLPLFAQWLHSIVGRLETDQQEWLWRNLTGVIRYYQNPADGIVYLSLDEDLKNRVPCPDFPDEFLGYQINERSFEEPRTLESLFEGPPS